MPPKKNSNNKNNNNRHNFSSLPTLQYNKTKSEEEQEQQRNSGTTTNTTTTTRPTTNSTRGSGGSLVHNNFSSSSNKNNNNNSKKLPRATLLLSDVQDLGIVHSSQQDPTTTNNHQNNNSNSSKSPNKKSTEENVVKSEFRINDHDHQTTMNNVKEEELENDNPSLPQVKKEEVEQEQRFDHENHETQIKINNNNEEEIILAPDELVKKCINASEKIPFDLIFFPPKQYQEEAVVVVGTREKKRGEYISVKVLKVTNSISGTNGVSFAFAFNNKLFIGESEISALMAEVCKFWTELIYDTRLSLFAAYKYAQQKKQNNNIKEGNNDDDSTSSSSSSDNDDDNSSQQSLLPFNAVNYDCVQDQIRGDTLLQLGIDQRALSDLLLERIPVLPLKELTLNWQKYFIVKCSCLRVDANNNAKMVKKEEIMMKFNDALKYDLVCFGGGVPSLESPYHPLFHVRIQKPPRLITEQQRQRNKNKKRNNNNNSFGELILPIPVFLRGNQQKQGWFVSAQTFCDRRRYYFVSSDEVEINCDSYEGFVVAMNNLDDDEKKEKLFNQENWTDVHQLVESWKEKEGEDNDKNKKKNAVGKKERKPQTRTQLKNIMIPDAVLKRFGCEVVGVFDAENEAVSIPHAVEKNLIAHQTSFLQIEQQVVERRRERVDEE